ncbi:SDR family oxidoreductase [Novosphingobium album (ex Liu et al. 2023)]|uniref:SDR family oxidoreductase n=1 Tax=Novosphingobium album (ex Liu et al. 2023) TaxID=3031130 RepID=A0ABT5WKV8_9SPHN|nr:SDR family oxidoreductase [Novosphingobium album (ex Liu et al. 2023)]MDE8650673.1 SDR family oxidoreductase [Novosphingobium album (ex Liu et al. 2023)]
MTTITRRNLLAASGTLAALSALPAARAATLPDLSGKSFLITGTSSGFGRIGAELYARRGARVFATMRNLPRPEAEELRRLARDEKLAITVLELDVLSDEMVARAVAEAERLNGGPLDVLVNNAGVVIGGPVEAHDLEATRLAFDTNVFGYQRTARAVLPGMRRRKSGLIVNISSQQGRVVMPAGGLYSASKFAVEAMSEQLAYELVPHGIDVVIIEPGGYPTEVGQNRAKYTQALRDRVTADVAGAYPEMVERMKAMRSARKGEIPPGMPDPVEVPTAIAEIAAMAPGTRPLRRAVHPGPKPQAEINRVSRESQLAWLGDGPYGPWVKDVLD